MQRDPPEGWSTLPRWVKDEWSSGHKDLHWYRSELQALVDHDANMRVIWPVLEKHRDALGRRGPPPDPDANRSQIDRRVIAEDVAKHVSGLCEKIEWLRRDSGFGLYPQSVFDDVYTATRKRVRRRMKPHFREAITGIMALLGEAHLPDDSRESLALQIENLQYAIEDEAIRLASDPRDLMRDLDASVTSWAAIPNQNTSEVIAVLGKGVQRWFDDDQRSVIATVATVATAMSVEEISEEMVRGVLVRRGILPSRKKVKTEKRKKTA
jgi:hypothetical protein